MRRVRSYLFGQEAGGGASQPNATGRGLGLGGLGLGGSAATPAAEGAATAVSVSARLWPSSPDLRATEASSAEGAASHPGLLCPPLLEPSQPSPPAITTSGSGPSPVPTTPPVPGTALLLPSSFAFASAAFASAAATASTAATAAAASTLRFAAGSKGAALAAEGGRSNASVPPAPVVLAAIEPTGWPCFTGAAAGGGRS